MSHVVERWPRYLSPGGHPTGCRCPACLAVARMAEAALDQAARWSNVEEERAPYEDSYDQRVVEAIEAEALTEALEDAEILSEGDASRVIFPSGQSLRIASGPAGPGQTYHDPNQTGNPLLDTSGANRQKRLSRNFTVDELAKSGSKRFIKARIDPKLIACLQAIRGQVGRAVNVTSGYRPFTYNIKIYRRRKQKPTKSRHSSGQAADIRVKGMSGLELAKAAIDACGGNIGIGIGRNSAHVDVRGEWRRWTYYRNSSTDRRLKNQIDAYRRRRTKGMSSALLNLQPFVSRETQPTVENALIILKFICRFSNIPWRIAYNILQHEGGLGRFKHQDGVMQTIKGTRDAIIPKIPPKIKLVLLGLPLTDKATENSLNRRLRKEFTRRLAVQIAVGIQVLIDNLRKFNGYIALAYVAYNTGSGAYKVVTGGERRRPRRISDSQWEKMCWTAASLLHQSPNEVRVEKGTWRCDNNIPTWYVTARVFDHETGRELNGYKYLRRYKICRREKRPEIPCNIENHRKKHRGSGRLICQTKRNGVLDKLYDPRKYGKKYYRIVRNDLDFIQDDNLPLKVVNGRLVKLSKSNAPN